MGGREFGLWVFEARVTHITRQIDAVFSQEDPDSEWD